MPDDPGAAAVTVWSLEMHSPDEIRAAVAPGGVDIRAATGARAWLSRDCYRAVGGPWHWVDRLPWTDEQWSEWAERPELELVTCWLGDALAGYYELEQQSGTVEIAYFGLTQRAIGRGIGGWLLSEALHHAWRLPDTTRVWVHTCTLDAPAALSNYQARGLRVFAESIEWRRITPPV